MRISPDIAAVKVSSILNLKFGIFFKFKMRLEKGKIVDKGKFIDYTALYWFKKTD